MRFSRQRLSILNLLLLPSLISPPARAFEAPLSQVAFINPITINTFVGNMTFKAPSIALSHGGGPLPLLGPADDPFHKDIVHSLKNRVPSILHLNDPTQRPRAIVLVTAHWSENNPTISSSAKHDLLYDYYNFPPEAYKLRYDAPGSPEIAQDLAAAMREEGLKPRLDAERGWDHGVFVPMMLIHPQADIPIVQVSVLASEDPTQLYAMGRALKRIREQNVAVMGSGFSSFHNLGLLRSSQDMTPGFKKRNIEWNEAMTTAVLEEDDVNREKMLKGWRRWPNTYEMHPRGGGEHFLPLIVAAGAGGEGKGRFYTDESRGNTMYSYWWN